MSSCERTQERLWIGFQSLLYYIAVLAGFTALGFLFMFTLYIPLFESF